MTVSLGIGFMPLLDAAPVIIAQELGFAREEGLDLDLHRAPSWSTLRDMLMLGRIEAAHMLSPVPVALALGLGGPVRLDAVSVMSANGTVVGVSKVLATRMRAAGYGFDFADAAGAGRALIAAATGPLRIGVPFPFSMHAELLYTWLTALGLPAPQSVQIRTVPPPLMAEALGKDEIDAFCVGEPWGSIAVETDVGELLLPGAAIWSFAPEKVLAVRHEWANAEGDLTARLIRAVWRAGRWLGDAQNHTTAAEILSRPAYVNVAAEVIDRGLSGRLTISARGDERERPDFIKFFSDNTCYPAPALGAWIGAQLAGRTGLDRESAAKAGGAVFRSDLFRAALASTGGALPAENDAQDRISGRGSFFDSRNFDLTTGR